MDEKMMETNETTTNMDMIPVEPNYEPVESSGGKGAWVVAAIGTLAVGAVGFGLHKAKGKLEEHQIKRLEKKGFKIIRPDEDVEVEYVNVEDDSEEESPEEENK